MTMPQARALTIWQPWASLIAAGVKRVETRSWATSYRGTLLVHAARRWDGDIAEAVEAAVARLAGMGRTLDRAGLAAASLSWRDTLGRVVAVARLADCRAMPEAPDATEAAFGCYGPGRFGWFLADVRPLARPVDCKGMQGLWAPPPDVLSACIREARRSAGG